MPMNITLHRALMAWVLAGALALVVALLVLPKAASAAPPEPVDFTERLGREYCGFPVLYEVSGKTKVINLPSGDTLFKNPGVRVTLTNLRTDEQVSYVVAGAARVRELESGELLVISTGRTVLNNPNIGILMPIGRFTFVIDEEGNFSQPTGKGRLIDACARLA
jgi:hypothetical protein